MTGTLNGPKIVPTCNNSAIHTGMETSFNMSFLSGLQNITNMTTYAHTNDHTCTQEHWQIERQVLIILGID